MENDSSRRQHNKAASVRSAQSYELMWLSCQTGEGIVGAAAAAKQLTARAARRVARFQVEDGLEDYYDEEQDRLDRLYLDEIVEEEDALRNGEAAWRLLPSGAEFLIDCNYDGVVYWCPQGTREACREALIEGGGQPYNETSQGAHMLVVAGLEMHAWELRAAPAWWYEEEEEA